jgi:hypothetical protein
VNWKNNRKGKFWQRRYDDQEIKTEADLLEAFLYVTTNPTRHGLVKDASRWPGLNSYEHCLDGQDRVYSFTEYSNKEGEKTTSHLLKLSILPQFEHISREARSVMLSGLLKQRLACIVEERLRNKKGFLTIEKVLQQTPGAVPEEVSRSSRPSCYTKDLEVRRAHREITRERRKRYTIASFLYRLGKKNYSFPPFSFKPPKHRLPRVAPFVVANQGQLKN